MSEFIIAAFYKFVSLPDYEQMRAPLGAYCRAHGVKGTILLATEGINGTIAGSRTGIDKVFAYLREDVRLTDVVAKESSADFIPFHRMKVKLKKEIVTLREDVDPTDEVGTYVAPDDWNDLISDPDVLLIDMRNDFEVQIGSFEGAINPETESFSEIVEYAREKLDPEKQKKVAMFCTGGIRCEKATSFFLKEGFENVYHLQGGILNYLEKVPQTATKWHGELFVFDERVTVDHDLQPGSYQLCRACWHPLSSAEIQSRHYEEGVSCPHCFAELTDEKKARLRERQKQVKLAEERGELHIGRTDTQ